jgi:hypothetical protein
VVSEGESTPYSPTPSLTPYIINKKNINIFFWTGEGKSKLLFFVKEYFKKYRFFFKFINLYFFLLNLKENYNFSSIF